MISVSRSVDTNFSITSVLSLLWNLSCMHPLSFQANTIVFDMMWLEIYVEIPLKDNNSSMG